MSGKDRVGNREALQVSVEGDEGFDLEGIHRFRVWFESSSHLPLKASAYDGSGGLVEEVLMDDLEINVPLEDGLFSL